MSQLAQGGYPVTPHVNNYVFFMLEKTRFSKNKIISASFLFSPKSVSEGRFFIKKF
jgi:hypothetical protein